MEPYLKEQFRVEKKHEEIEKVEDKVTPELEFISFCRSHLREIVMVFHESKIKQLHIKTDDIGINMVRKRQIPAALPAAGGTPPEVSVERELKPVISRHLGIFHLNNQKGIPYVKAGDSVKKGQILASIETMNILNFIKADRNGTIRKILEEEGKPVEYGQILFLMEVSQ